LVEQGDFSLFYPCRRALPPAWPADATPEDRSFSTSSSRSTALLRWAGASQKWVRAKLEKGKKEGKDVRLILQEAYKEVKS
jgi:hypothetical protein